MVKEFLLLQPDLPCAVRSLGASCALLHHNVITEPAAVEVAVQLLRELLPVLVERQPPIPPATAPPTAGVRCFEEWRACIWPLAVGEQSC